MSTFVTVLHVVLCVFMVIVVLLQTGKSDMGAAFGGASQTVFGAGGAVSFLGKVTTATAVLFMCTSIYLAYSSNRAVRSGSVLEGLEEELEAPETNEVEPDAGIPPIEPPTAPANDVSGGSEEAPPTGELPAEGQGASDETSAPAGDETAP